MERMATLVQAHFLLLKGKELESGESGLYQVFLLCVHFNINMDSTLNFGQPELKKKSQVLSSTRQVTDSSLFF